MEYYGPKNFQEIIPGRIKEAFSRINAQNNIYVTFEYHSSCYYSVRIRFDSRHGVDKEEIRSTMNFMRSLRITKWKYWMLNFDTLTLCLSEC